MPSTIAMTIAANASSSVAGMRWMITFSALSPKMKLLPRSPFNAPIDEVRVLLPDRPVEAERADGGLDVLLVGLRVDQQIDRIADDVDAEEHDHRHDDDDERALHQPAQDEGGHDDSRAVSACGGSCRVFPGKLSGFPEKVRSAQNVGPPAQAAPTYASLAGERIERVCTRRRARCTSGPSSHAQVLIW